jgi:hypothetical protein
VVQLIGVRVDVDEGLLRKTFYDDVPDGEGRLHLHSYM